MEVNKFSHPQFRKTEIDSRLEREIASVLNRYNIDTATGMPDYVLAAQFMDYIRDTVQIHDEVRFLETLGFTKESA